MVDQTRGNQETLPVAGGVSLIKNTEDNTVDIFTILGYPHDTLNGQPVWTDTEPSAEVIAAVQALDTLDHLATRFEDEPLTRTLKNLVTAPQWLALKTEQRKQIHAERAKAFLANPYFISHLATGGCQTEFNACCAEVCAAWPEME